MTTTLSGLLDAYFDERWHESPEEASGLGLTEHAGRLGEYSADAFERRAERAASWLKRLEDVADDGLDVDERIDRDLVVSRARGDLLAAAWTAWRRSPDVYLYPGLSGVFELLLHRIQPEPELAAAVASRLRQVPRILQDGMDNLDPELASPIFVERSIGMCRAASAYARSMVPAEVAPEHRGEVADAGEQAARAYDGFLAFLQGLQKDARGDYAIGEEHYSALLRDKEMLGYGARDMRERGRAEFDRIAAEMAARSKDLHGTTDFVAVVRELNADHPTTPEQMRDAYAEWTERARAFLVERDLVTLPDGERCNVVPSPTFQRPVLAVASYNPPPMLTGDRTGHFFVPYPPEGISDEEIAQRLESNSYATIPTVSVHEAYPGHHWHLTAMTLNPRIARKALYSSYFTEGWALYVESMMLEEGFYDDPRHELGALDARLFRAARIVVDTSLHIGDMSFEEAVTFMMERTGMAEPTARAEVGRYCSWPTQAPSYLTGALEIERMRAAYLAAGGTLKDFHDTIGRSGALPIALAERALTRA